MAEHLTVKQVAQLTGLSEAAIRANIFYGKFRVVKFGRAVRIPADWLTKYIEQNTHYEQK